MDILAFAKEWGNPAVVGSAIVFLLVSIKYLSARIARIDNAVVSVRDNHLHSLSGEMADQSKSLVRIETTLSLLPCKDKTDCPSKPE